MSHDRDSGPSNVVLGRFGPRRGRLRALITATHPGPTVAVTALAVILSFSIGLDPLRIIEVAAAVLFGQLAIGWSNDWLDARRDTEVGRTDKPIANGSVSAATVRNCFIVAALISIPLSLLLGLDAAISHLVLVASGLSYNLFFKKTSYSWLPYVVSFGLLPTVVTFSDTPPEAPMGWVVAVGSLLGLAAHFANVLPDLDDDRKTGIRGLPHRLGRVPSGVASFAALLGASLAILIGAGPSVVTLVGIALGALIAGVGIWLVLTRPPGRVLFQLIIAGALVDVVLLALSGSQLSI